MKRIPCFLAIASLLSSCADQAYYPQASLSGSRFAGSIQYASPHYRTSVYAQTNNRSACAGNSRSHFSSTTSKPTSTGWTQSDIVGAVGLAALGAWFLMDSGSPSTGQNQDNGKEASAILREQNRASYNANPNAPLPSPKDGF